jgi:hypothetical protein
VLAQQVFENGNGFFDELSLRLRRHIAHHFVGVGVAGDTMSGFLDGARDFGVFFQRRAADQPGAADTVLAHDIEQTPGAAPGAVLPLAVVERIGLAVGHGAGGLLRLMMHANRDRQAHAVGPAKTFLITFLVPHERLLRTGSPGSRV